MYYSLAKTLNVINSMGGGGAYEIKKKHFKEKLNTLKSMCSRVAPVECQSRNPLPERMCNFSPLGWV